MSGPLSKIINYRYRDSAADLIHALREGPVQGYKLNNNSNNQSWEIVSVGGDRITLKNGTTGTYARPAFEAVGAPVVGSVEPYEWKQSGVVGGWYQISTNREGLHWFLTGPEDYAPIILREPGYKGEEAQWGYEPTKRVG